MALINCPDCSTPVSDQAVNCIKCGRPIRCDTQRKKRQQSYKQIQTLWHKSIIPLIDQIFVLGMIGFLGFVVKFISLFFTLGINKVAVSDIWKIAISESGPYILGAYIVLFIVLKLKISSWLNEVFPTVTPKANTSKIPLKTSYQEVAIDNEMAERVELNAIVSTDFAEGTPLNEAELDVLGSVFILLGFGFVGLIFASFIGLK